MSYIDSVINNDSSILLKMYKGENLLIEESAELSKIEKESNVIRICFLDFETTGLDVEDSEVIEVAMKLVEFNKEDGSIISAVKEYESYNDPCCEIEEKITNLTGITNEMVKGHSINWDTVKDLLKLSQLVVAHNAPFDRKFLEKYTESNNVWACSKEDVNWSNRGFMKNNLESLCVWHGFYYGAHRAMNDVNAMIHLLSHTSYNSDNTPILELIGNAKKTHFKIINVFPYNEQYIKLLKKRGGYRFNSENKSWNITLNDQSVVDEEVAWLTENIYQGHFRGVTEIITIKDKYKS